MLELIIEVWTIAIRTNPVVNRAVMVACFYHHGGHGPTTASVVGLCMYVNNTVKYESSLK